MTTPKPKSRSRHSFRDPIREVIRRRLARGEPLHIQKILTEVGGGSITTVRQELAEMIGAEKVRASTLIGAGASTIKARVQALEAAIDAAMERERLLQAEVVVLKDALQSSRDDVAKLLAIHQDSQRLLMQGVDDLREMVKAGQGALPVGIVETERANVSPKEVRDASSGDAFYWHEKHDQLLRRHVNMEKENREMAALLHDLGVSS
jgi:hypothetical protein